MNNFFTSIALSNASIFSAQDVAQELARLCGSAPLALEIVQPSLRTNPHGFILSVNGVEVAVLPLNEPLPRDGYEAAAEGSILWPNAKTALGANKAHVVVAALRAAGSHGEALAAAFAVTVIAAAVIRRTDAIGAVFNPALTAFPADQFVGIAIGLAQQRQIPEMLWVSLAFRPGQPAPDGQPTVGLTTLGLSAFAGREIEFLPVAWQPGHVAGRVLGLAQYLILHGPVIKDGDTVGDTPAERIAVHLADRGVWLKTPVMILSVGGARQ